jgi:hypothetical protein
MSFTAIVLKIMIASPRDVPQERYLVREVINEWNAVHAEDRRVVLQPVGWETHASPEMGDRAQAIINKQILAGCDLLVATFWTRLGSPTGVAPSGTVEEIEEHIALGKPALIYFSSAPVRLDSVDAVQYEALTQFKRSCRSRGLVEEYDDLASFRAKFSRHLAQTVIRLLGQGIAQPSVLLPEVAQPEMSPEANELLISATDSSDGVVMQINTLEGLYVQANNRNHVTPGNPRSEARWRSALQELLKLGFLEDRLGAGEVFNITESGYKVAAASDRQSPRLHE